jgi:hypothetical protein
MFRFYSDKNSGSRVTVVGEHSEGMLKVGVSRCSNGDTFDRKKGVAIAKSRMDGGKTYTKVPMEECNVKEFITIARAIAPRVQETKIVY